MLCMNKHIRYSYTSSLLLFTGIFLTSLLSHGPISWLFSAILLSTFLVVTKNTDLNKGLKQYLIVSIIVCIYGLKYILWDTYFVPDIYDASFINNFLLFAVICLLWWNYITLFSNESLSTKVHSVVKLVLYLHLILIIMQLCLYIFFGFYFDFVEPFTGEVSRNDFFLNSYREIGYIRPTGFFVEPSTFTASVICLLAIHIIHNDFEFDKLIVISLVTIIISFSTVGILAALLLTCLLLIISFRRYFKLILSVAFVLLCSSAIWHEVFFDIVQMQVSKFQRGSGMRTGLLSFFFERDGIHFLTGYGPFGVEEQLSNAVSSGQGVRSFASMNDSGNLVFLLLRFGLIGGVLFFILILLQSSFRNMVLFIIVSLTKVSILHPIFLFYLAFSFSKSSNHASIKKL